MGRRKQLNRRRKFSKQKVVKEMMEILDAATNTYPVTTSPANEVVFDKPVHMHSEYYIEPKLRIFSTLKSTTDSIAFKRKRLK